MGLRVGSFIWVRQSRGRGCEGIPQGLKPTFFQAMKPKAEALGYLDVVRQEVIVIETRSADGWKLVETGVWSVPVVLMSPDRQ